MSTSNDGRSDLELVRAAQRDPASVGGRAAAGELFARYRVRAYVWCHRVVRDHDTALDLAQDALLSAYRALPGFDARAQFSSWLFAIVRNRCLTSLRTRILVRDESVDPDALLADGGDPLDHVAVLEEQDAVLEAIMAKLEPMERNALWLRAIERMPVDEITRRLGIAGASGARGVLQSARRKLRAHLEARSESAS